DRPGEGVAMAVIGAGVRVERQRLRAVPGVTGASAAHREGRSGRTGDEEVRGRAGDDRAHNVAGPRDGTTGREVDVYQPIVLRPTGDAGGRAVAAAPAGGGAHLARGCA